MTALAVLRRVFLLQPLLGAVALVIVGLALMCMFARAAWASGFGVKTFSEAIQAPSQWPATQAGSHPDALTGTVVFEHTVIGEEEETYEENLRGEEIPTGEPAVVARIDGNPRTLTLNLPAGVVINPAATPVKCTEGELETNPNAGGACPAAAAVGTVTVDVSGLGEKVKAAVYDMQAPANVPAEFGVDAGNIGLVMHMVGRVRTGGDYGFSAEVAEIGESSSIYGLSLTLWGDPSDPSHDSQRGACASSGPVQKAIEEEKFEQENLEDGFVQERYNFDCPTEVTDLPFLTLPGACTGGPLETTLTATSWQSPQTVVAPPPATLPAVTGCEAPPFKPTFEVAPEPTPGTAESPTGLNVSLAFPREESQAGLAEADLRRLTLTLPPGMTISPAAAGGLEACASPPAGSEPPPCPDASKLGELEVRTPLLEAPLRGGVYLAQPDALSGSLVGLYLTASADGVAIELPATAALDPLTGQITLTLSEAPQLPLGEVRLRLFGGPRAALQTPADCGSYAATAQLTPWSTGAAAPTQLASRPFAIAAGCTHDFAPSFLAGVSDARAGAFTPFTLTIARRGGERQLASVGALLPPGLVAAVKGVARCPDAQAAAGSCPAASRLGAATLAVGPGEDPYWAPAGSVYLTDPYEGAPLGLAIVVDVRAGPFDLGPVVVRARATIDSHTAQLDISTDRLPAILDGVPLDVRTIALDIDRPEFVLAPSSCAPMAVAGTLVPSTGASASVSSPFAVAGCAGLPFKPTFLAYTRANTTRKQGAGFSVRVRSGAGQANIERVRLILPAQLPGRLTTLQHACPAATFDANPAACPPASAVGVGDARTSLLDNPLTGPAYLVSRGAGAFPDLVFVLSGEGVTIYLDGNLDIKHSLISATFDSIPDVPVESFAASFPQGPGSIFAANLPARARGRMCGQDLRMPTEIAAHDGAQWAQTTRIIVTGCPRRKLRAPRRMAETRGRSRRRAVRRAASRGIARR